MGTSRDGAPTALWAKKQEAQLLASGWPWLPLRKLSWRAVAAVEAGGFPQLENKPASPSV